jgi:hypothetical protein
MPNNLTSLGAKIPHSLKLFKIIEYIIVGNPPNQPWVTDDDSIYVISYLEWPLIVNQLQIYNTEHRLTIVS